MVKDHLRSTHPGPESGVRGNSLDNDPEAVLWGRSADHLEDHPRWSRSTLRAAAIDVSPSSPRITSWVLRRTHNWHLLALSRAPGTMAHLEAVIKEVHLPRRPRARLVRYPHAHLAARVRHSDSLRRLLFACCFSAAFVASFVQTNTNLIHIYG